MNKKDILKSALVFKTNYDFIYEAANKIVNDGIIPVLQQVPNNFLNLQDSRHDAIYGFNVEDETVGQQEVRIRGIRLYDGKVFLFLTPTTDQVDFYTNEDMMEEFYTDSPYCHWEPLTGADVLYVQTVLALAESIMQYTEDK